MLSSLVITSSQLKFEFKLIPMSVGFAKHDFKASMAYKSDNLDHCKRSYGATIMHFVTRASVGKPCTLQKMDGDSTIISKCYLSFTQVAT